MSLRSQGVRRTALGVSLAVVIGAVLGVGAGLGPSGDPAAPVLPAALPVGAPVLPAPPVVPVLAEREDRPAAPVPVAAEQAAPPRAAAEDEPDDEPAAPADDAADDDVETDAAEEAEDADEAEDAEDAEEVPVGPTAVPVGTDSTELVDGTPCTAAARACVDLDDRTAWLLDDGEIVKGPVSVQIGDEMDPTPLGTFTVEWKAEQWTSREYFTQMPYSVFFAAGGIAFHEGRQDTNSAGCVKLVREDAQEFFEYLQVGDQVQIR